MKTYALVQTEPATRRTWLSFPHMPPGEVRSSLRELGWKYDASLRSWFYPSIEAPPTPSGVILALGGTCTYTEFSSPCA